MSPSSPAVTSSTPPRPTLSEGLASYVTNTAAAHRERLCPPPMCALPVTRALPPPVPAAGLLFTPLKPSQPLSSPLTPQPHVPPALCTPRAELPTHTLTSCPLAHFQFSQSSLLPPQPTDRPQQGLQSPPPPSLAVSHRPSAAWDKATLTGAPWTLLLPPRPSGWLVVQPCCPSRSSSSQRCREWLRRLSMTVPAQARSCLQPTPHLASTPPEHEVVLGHRIHREGCGEASVGEDLQAPPAVCPESDQ